MTPHGNVICYKPLPAGDNPCSNLILMTLAMALVGAAGTDTADPASEVTDDVEEGERKFLGCNQLPPIVVGPPEPPGSGCRPYC